MRSISPSTPALPESLRVRGWTLDGPLGIGGMGRVYTVREPVLDRPLALKIARGPAGGPAWRRLHRESYLTAAIAGEGIVAVHEVGAAPDGRPWFTMSMAPGQPLTELLAAARAPAQRRALLPFLARVARHLSRVHRLGVVHRDLKPDNILIDTPSGAVTVLDWGLARQLADASAGDSDEATDPAWSSKTADGVRLGTPGYMSPEQASGQEVDARADVWALGIVLWELLAGQRAYPGQHAPTVISAILRGEPPMAPIRWAGRALTAVIAGALAPLASRYPDASALYAALRSATASPPQRWRLPAAVATAGAAGALAASLLLPSPEPTAAQPPEALVEVLGDAARSMARAGARSQAELMAAAALEQGGPASLRGILLSRSPRPQLQLDVERPRCDIGEMFTPNGQFIACANTDHTIGYIIEEDRVVQSWKQDIEVHQFASMGPGWLLGQVPAKKTGVIMSVAHGGPLVISSTLGEGVLIQSMTSRAILNHLPDGRWYRQNIDQEDLWQVWREPPCPPQRALVLPDGSEVYACAGVIVHIDGDDFSERTRWQLPGETDTLAVLTASLDGRVLGVLLNDGMHATIPIDGEAHWSMGPATNATRIRLSSTGRYVVLSDEMLHRVWDRLAPERVWSVPGYEQNAAFDDQDRLLLLSPTRLRRWVLPGDTASSWRLGQPIRELRWSAGGLVARLADGTVHRQGDGPLAAAGPASSVAVSSAHEKVAWALPSGEVQLEGQAPLPIDASCRRLEWLDDQTLLCAPEGPGPLLIDTETRVVDHSLGRPNSSWFTTNSQPGAAALLEWSGTIWRVHGEPLRMSSSSRLPWTNTIALSADGRTVAAGSGQGIGLLDTETDTLIAEFEAASRIGRVEYSPDGRWLVGTTYHGDVHIYRDAVLVAHHILPTSHALLPAFSPDSRYLALAGRDGVVEQLDLSELDRPLAEVIAEVRAAWGVRYP